MIFLSNSVNTNRIYFNVMRDAYVETKIIVRFMYLTWINSALDLSLHANAFELFSQCNCLQSAASMSTLRFCLVYFGVKYFPFENVDILRKSFSFFKNIFGIWCEKLKFKK